MHSHSGQAVRASVNSGLHARWFLQSAETRVLFPINITHDATFVDCNDTYADLFQLTRTNILEGKFRITQLLREHTLERLAWSMPVLLSYGAIECHNVPCVNVSDMVAMIIYEDGSTGPLRSPKRPSAPAQTDYSEEASSLVPVAASVRQPKYI